MWKLDRFQETGIGLCLEAPGPVNLEWHHEKLRVCCYHIELLATALLCIKHR